MHTQDPSSLVYVNTAKVGQGEIVKSRIRKDGPAQVVIEREGQKEDYAVLMPSHRSVMFYLLQIPNTITMGLGWFYDFYNEKNIRYARNQHFESRDLSYIRFDSTQYRGLVLDSVFINYDSNMAHFKYISYDYVRSAERQKMLRDRAIKQEESGYSKYKRPKVAQRNGIYEISDFINSCEKYFATVLQLTGAEEPGFNPLHLSCRVNQGTLHRVLNTYGDSYRFVDLECMWYLHAADGTLIGNYLTRIESGQFVVNNKDVLNDAVANNFLELQKNAKFMAAMKK